MNMKRVYALALTVFLLLGAVNTAFAENYDATFSLTGYEIGKKITEIGVEIDNSFYELHPVTSPNGIQVNAVIGTDFSTKPTMVVDGVFEEGKEYFIDIYFVRQNHHEFTNEENRNFIKDVELRLFDGSEPIDKSMASHVADAPFEVLFHLPVLQSPDLPKTGDESNIMLCAVLACMGVMGMMLLRRKEAKI